jgi:hypothetical protein
MIVALDLPRAVPRWSEEFQVERIAPPGFSQRLYVLVSEPLPAGPKACLEPLRTFFAGVLEASEAGDVISRRPYFQLQRMAAAHEHLASLARSTEEPDVADRHAKQAAELRRAAEDHQALR